MSRTVKFDEVVEAASALCGQAACFLPEDVKKSLLDAAKRETGELGKEFLKSFKSQAASLKFAEC